MTGVMMKDVKEGTIRSSGVGDGSIGEFLGLYFNIYIILLQSYVVEIFL